MGPDRPYSVLQGDCPAARAVKVLGRAGAGWIETRGIILPLFAQTPRASLRSDPR